MRRIGPLVLVWVLLVTACGDDSGRPIFDSTTQPTVTSTTVGTTTTTGVSSTAATTTTAPATTTTTAGLDDFWDGNAFEVEARPPDSEPSGPGALLAGAPDTTASRALVAEAAASGYDLVAFDVVVWPVWGSTESLLILEGTAETQATVGGESGAADDLLAILLASEIIDRLNVTRVVINYRDSDEEGPFVLTFTASVAALRASLETGEDPVDAVVQLVRLQS